MNLLPRDKTIDRSIRIKQDLCGCIFIFLSVLNFILFYAFPRSQFPVGGVIVLGVLALCGFGILYTLASSLISDLFAASQFACELFFSVLLPMMMCGFVQQDIIIYIMCMVFCFVSIFFWSQLFYNHKFSGRQLWALVLLPLPTFFNFAIYYSYVHISSPYIYDILRVISALPIKALMMLYLCWGYWTLTHSSAFAANKYDEENLSLNPFNVYSLAYIAILVVILCF